MAVFSCGALPAVLVLFVRFFWFFCLPCFFFCFVFFLSCNIEEGQRGLRFSFVHYKIHTVLRTFDPFRERHTMKSKSLSIVPVRFVNSAGAALLRDIRSLNTAAPALLRDYSE